MNKKICFFLYGVIGLLSLTHFSINVFAKENPSNVIKNFSYEVLFPENQQNQAVGYYDLLMEPGTEQVIQLKLNNTSNDPMEIEICMNSAKTNGNGVIEYGPNKIKKDASLTYDLSELMTGPERVKLSPNSSELISFTISLPANPIEGYLAAGIQLKPVVADNSQQKQQNIILNKVAFLIGVLVHESDLDKIKPELELNNVYVKLMQGVYSLFVNLSNTQGVFVEDMAMDIKIREKNKQETFLEFKKKNMRMAPNSMIDLPVSLADKKITAGEYTTDIHVKAADGKDWVWSKNFTLTNIEARQINQQFMEEKNKSNFNIWWFVSFFLLVIVIVGVVVFTYKKKHSKAGNTLKKKH